MDKNQIKKIVAEMLNKGTSLSDIQKALRDEHQANMTFLDLRLLAAELENVDWGTTGAEDAAQKEEEAKAAKAAKVDGEDDLEEEDGEEAAPGAIKVELSPLQRPGALASGSVNFPSGCSADWILDQRGRLGLDNAKGGKPTPEDIQAFQVELQRLLAGM